VRRSDRVSVPGPGAGGAGSARGAVLQAVCAVVLVAAQRVRGERRVQLVRSRHERGRPGRCAGDWPARRPGPPRLRPPEGAGRPALRRRCRVAGRLWPPASRARPRSCWCSAAIAVRWSAWVSRWARTSAVTSSDGCAPSGCCGCMDITAHLLPGSDQVRGVLLVVRPTGVASAGAGVRVGAGVGAAGRAAPIPAPACSGDSTRQLLRAAPVARRGRARDCAVSRPQGGWCGGPLSGSGAGGRNNSGALDRVPGVRGSL
jgi:hypothetical protein